MKPLRWLSAFLILCVFSSPSVRAQDVADLAGVRPGELFKAAGENRAVVRSSMPFTYFGVPTRLPTLAQIFPSGDVYLLRDGTVAGIRWQRAYATEQECASAAESVRKLLRPYFPGNVIGNDAPRYQYQSSDSTRGVGISCRPNEGGYHNAMVELVHFATDKKLTESLGAR
jgi:hypothetical protein